MLRLREDFKNTYGWYIKKLCLFIASNLLGLGLSAFVFIPTVYFLRNGAGAQFNFSSLFAIELLGHPLSIFQNYVLHMNTYTGNLGNPIIYIGLPILITVITCFFYQFKYKKSSLFLLLTVLSVFYLKNLFFLFSLLQDVYSYHYRYSFIGSFSFLVVAATFWETGSKPKWLLNGALLFFCFMFFANCVRIGEKNIEITLRFLLIYIVILALKKSDKNLSLFLLLCLILELFSNLKFYSHTNLSTINSFYNTQTSLIKKIQDDSFFRINNFIFLQENDGLTAHFNQSLLFNYNGISTYTSTAASQPSKFIDMFGYKSVSGNKMNIVTQPLFPIDSVLGVKYYLSEDKKFNFNFLNRIACSDFNCIYKNTFALPIIFSSNFNLDEELKNLKKFNQLERQNYLINKWAKVEDNIFKILQTYNAKQINFNTNNYSNPLILETNSKAKVYLNDKLLTKTGERLSTRYLYLPNKLIPIRIIGESGNVTAKIFEFDTSAYIRQMQRIQKNINTVKFIKKNSTISLFGLDNKDNFLYLTIPWSNGWSAVVNDSLHIEPKRFLDTFIMIPLKKEYKNIDLVYSTPYMNLGLIISSICMFFCILLSINNNFLKYLLTRLFEIKNPAKAFKLFKNRY